MEEITMKNCFLPADILLPDLDKVSGKAWSVIACDQFTSEPEYWESAAKAADGSPSALNMIIPEVYLSETEKRIPLVHEAMEEYLKNVLVSHPDAMIYVEREQSDGRVRCGIVGAVDLECYDYTKGSDALIRATEGTVLSRIPPRVAVRREAVIELPHIMMLIDDKEKTVVEPLANKALEVAYDFDLMLGGGHIKGYFIDRETQVEIIKALEGIASPAEMERKYGKAGLSPLLFAVGDGNHSLATAKASFEEIKARDGETAMTSPARYALAEIVNLHDDALDFEPIYRVVFGADKAELLSALKKYIENLRGDAKPQKLICVSSDDDETIEIYSPEAQLTVGTLQSFLDDYCKDRPYVEVDYIHGEDSLRALASKGGALGFLFSGMEKNELFKTVIFDGALPRKTFSMGHARDKRYYLECRKIK